MDLSCRCHSVLDVSLCSGQHRRCGCAACHRGTVWRNSKTAMAAHCFLGRGCLNEPDMVRQTDKSRPRNPTDKMMIKGQDLRSTECQMVVCVLRLSVRGWLRPLRCSAYDERADRRSSACWFGRSWIVSAEISTMIAAKRHPKQLHGDAGLG